MNRHDTAGRLTHLLLGLLLAGISGAAAAYYPQQYGYQQPGMYPQQYPQQYPQYQYQYQYPQQYPDNSGATQQSGPYWSPYQQQMQPAVHYEPPRVEASVSDSSPYEQQSLVYRIRIISDGNVKSVSPVVPQVADAVLRSLGDPVSGQNNRGDGLELTTEYRYLLMPLSSGSIEIPAPHVTGRYSANGGDGPAFDVAGNPVRMRVRAAPDAVQPWLPLYNLQITARVRGNEAPAAGNPIELEVETRAVGATGSQIPSVAPYLAGDDFRIYPGKSVSDGNVSADGKTLQGRRVESFTLVPRYGGWLQLPGVSVNWWNVRYNRPEVASLLTDQINVMGPSNPERGNGGKGGTLSSAIFWLPMGIAVGILLFGWLSAFMGDGRMPGTDWVKNLFQPLLGQLYSPMVALANRFSPRRSLHRLRTWTGRHLPISWKLWFCLRAVSRENDPAEWAHALQILASKHLGVRPQSHLRQLGESIVRCHPGANAAEVDRLLAELDQAVYGNKPIYSFPRWKRDFKRQIKPGLFPIRFRQCAVRERLSSELPTLNPQ